MRKWEVFEIDKSTIAIMDRGFTIATVTVSCFKSKADAMVAARKIAAVPDLIEGCRAGNAICNAQGIDIHHAIAGEMYEKIITALQKANL